MEEEPETHKLSPAMKKFFSRLLEIKNFTKKKADSSKDRDWVQVYKDLDKLFQPKEMHQ